MDQINDECLLAFGFTEVPRGYYQDFWIAKIKFINSEPFIKLTKFYNAYLKADTHIFFTKDKRFSFWDNLGVLAQISFKDLIPVQRFPELSLKSHFCHSCN
jgi:hypothetical protein